MTTPQFDAEGPFGDDCLYFSAVAGYGEDGQPLTADSRRMIAVGRI